MASSSQAQPRAALLVTCLVDLFRPSVGFAANDLVEGAGCRVEVPPTQTCCGQPAHNAGATHEARAIAKRVIGEFADHDYVVAPSGSCAGMVHCHYPELFEDDPDWQTRARALAGKTFELTSFLVDRLGVDKVASRLDGIAAYHDGCSGKRELGISAQPRRLLQSVEGLEVRERKDPGLCCGFGGTFAVTFDRISARMTGDCARDLEGTGAQFLLGGDLGCLLNLAGWLRRKGSPVEVRHVAEILAGRMDTAPIGRAG